MNIQANLPTWSIGREGRAWNSAEMLAKLALLPTKLEVVGGKLCLGEEQRILLLAALLENLGTDVATKLGGAGPWRESILAREEEQAAVGGRQHQQSGSDLLSLANLMVMAGESVLDEVPSTPTSVHTWNCRVLEFCSADGERWAAVHEVFYDGGKPSSYSKNPAVVLWNPTDGELAPLRCLDRMRSALLKVALTEADFPAG